MVASVWSLFTVTLPCLLSIILQKQSQRVRNALQRSINHVNFLSTTSFPSNMPKSTIISDMGEYHENINRYTSLGILRRCRYRLLAPTVTSRKHRSLIRKIPKLTQKFLVAQASVNLWMELLPFPMQKKFVTTQFLMLWRGILQQGNSSHRKSHFWLHCWPTNFTPKNGIWLWIRQWRPLQQEWIRHDRPRTWIGVSYLSNKFFSWWEILLLPCAGLFRTLLFKQNELGRWSCGFWCHVGFY